MDYKFIELAGAVDVPLGVIRQKPDELWAMEPPRRRDPDAFHNDPAAKADRASRLTRSESIIPGGMIRSVAAEKAICRRPSGIKGFPVARIGKHGATLDGDIKPGEWQAAARNPVTASAIAPTAVFAVIYRRGLYLACEAGDQPSGSTPSLRYQWSVLSANRFRSSLTCSGSAGDDRPQRRLLGEYRGGQSGNLPHRGDVGTKLGWAGAMGA